jgi:predicted PurR-regulated permease PerM
VATKNRAISVDHPIIVTFLIFAVIGFLSLASDVLKPLALAVLLAFAVSPLLSILERAKLPRSLAVVLAILIPIGALGAVAYRVGEQFTELAGKIPEYRRKLVEKFDAVQPGKSELLQKMTRAGAELENLLEQGSQSGASAGMGTEEADAKGPALGSREGTDAVAPVPVRIVARYSLLQWVQSAVGPTLESLGLGAFVLILVLFMLIGREDLSDRLVRLFGLGRVSLTTRTMDEVGQRISRYLFMLTVVNSSIGIVVALGLWLIGVGHPLLWGALAALFRFVPYVGPAAAFILPLLFSVASSTGWREPVMVVGLFGLLEALANTFIEPIVYGKTTGVTALGLLVAAMFWTWLWGPLGLLLSTPLTLSLAVMGKYVSGLKFLAILLGEEAALEPDIRFYQRLLAIDPEGATQVFETALKQRPRARVFQEILVPTLSRAERDHARGSIDDREHAFVLRFMNDVLDELEQTPALDLKSLTATAGETPVAEHAEPNAVILGIAINNQADALALKMLAILLEPSGCELTTLTDIVSPLKLSERIAHQGAQLIVFSDLPPVGSTAVRYFVRRLRAGLTELPILVGLWGVRADPSETVDRLTNAGASAVVFDLDAACEQILKTVFPQTAKPEPTPALTSTAAPSVPT